MYKYTLPATMSARDRRYRRRADPAASEELLLLFDEPSPRARPMTGTGLQSPDGQSDLAPASLPGNTAVLTLGGNAAVVAVRPEPPVKPSAVNEHPFAGPGAAATIDEDLQHSRELEEQMAGRLHTCRERRRALAELADWSETCRAEGAVPPGDDGARPAEAETPDVVPTPAARPLALRFLRWTPRSARPRKSPLGARFGRRRAVRLASPGRSPFAWRKMLMSAACLAGPGLVVLLVVHWIAG